jgi:hypothetical protein
MKANRGVQVVILLATAWLFLLVAGCGRSPAPSSLYVGGPTGVISWAPPAGMDLPVPGIDYGTVYHVGTAFVVWSDAPGGGGGSTSSSEEGVKCQGSLLARDGRRVEFHCDTKDGKTGPGGGQRDCLRLGGRQLVLGPHRRRSMPCDAGEARREPMDVRAR